MKINILSAILVIKLMLVSCSILSQGNSCFGLGLDAGFKGSNNKGGFIAEFTIRQRLTFMLGFCSEKHTNWGWSAGVEGYLLKSNWRIAPGISYNTWTSTEFYTGEGDDQSNWSNYRVPSSANVVAVIGLNRILDPDDPLAYGKLSITPYISYRYNLNDTKVELESGVYREDEIHRINRRLAGGIGFGVKIIFLLNRNDN